MTEEKREAILQKIRDVLDNFVSESECEGEFITDDFTIEEFNQVCNEVL